jgi:2-polyprenyl-3-methyl-5-hydroxy-6-metoxy-1,4-benzoquinol methylase
MEYIKTNRAFWNRYSKERGPWSRRSPKELIDKARQGGVEIFITTQKLVPVVWLPESWSGLKVLGLAAGGGQQMPIIAAAGADVTSFDLSEEQLQRDLEVCREEGLKIEILQGDMRDLSLLSDSYFDLIINPVSNCFIDDVNSVWKECFRVLRPGGLLMSGSNNPVTYALDLKAYDEGKLSLCHKIPYSDLRDLSESERAVKIEQNDAFEFGHSLSELIGGQIAAGLVIKGFYEDEWGEGFDEPIDKILPQFFATLAQKRD